LPSRNPPKGVTVRHRQRDFPFGCIVAPKSSSASEPRWVRRIRPPRREGSVEPGKAPPRRPSEEGWLGAAGRTQPPSHRPKATGWSGSDPEGAVRIGPRRSGGGSVAEPLRSRSPAGVRPSEEGRASVRMGDSSDRSRAPRRSAASDPARRRRNALGRVRPAPSGDEPKLVSVSAPPNHRAASRAASRGTFHFSERARATAPIGGRLESRT
jgi:hypothetical protein